MRDASLIPLSHQHHNGLALCILIRRSLAADSSPENLAKCARKAIDRYEVELINHFEIEEQVLFPACEGIPLVATLLSQHRELESQIANLRTSPSPELLEQFCELLTRHIRLEENELFQEAQKILPRDVLDQIGTEIDRRAIRVCL